MFVCSLVLMTLNTELLQSLWSLVFFMAAVGLNMIVVASRCIGSNIILRNKLLRSSDNS